MNSITVLKKIRVVDLAECLGVTPGYAWQIKSGKRPLPEKYIEMISSKFDIPVSKLVNPALVRKIKEEL